MTIQSRLIPFALARWSGFRRFAAFTRKQPVVRGMLSYASIWPTSCIIQQVIAGKTVEEYDWVQAIRFSLYGGLFVAPTLYGWVRLSSFLWPQTTLRTAITKVYIIIYFVMRFNNVLQAVVEQMTYGPMAMCCFFFTMNFLKTYSIDEATEEVKHKFWPTYTVCISLII